MAHSFDKCPNCGAPVEISSDGRAAHCPYCGAGGAHKIDPGALAASLRGDAKSLVDVFESLATRLAREFPDQTEVRKSGGFLAAKHVEELVVQLENTTFRMTRAGRHLVAERIEVVRGITLKTEALSPEAWVEALCDSLAALASSSAGALAALGRMARG